MRVLQVITWKCVQITWTDCARSEYDATSDKSGHTHDMMIDNSTKVILDGFETKHITG